MATDQKELIHCLEFAREKQYVLSVRHIKTGKTTNVLVDHIELESFSGRFANSKSKMSKGYKFENVADYSFENETNQQEYEKKCFAEIMQNAEDAMELIQRYEKYYQDIIPHAKEKHDLSPEEREFFIRNTQDIYNIIFGNIYHKADGLLLNYLLSKEVNKSREADNQPVILLSQSNYSQKQAIEAALHNRVSVIEGPPGTGKTTTILSIVANLVIRGKRVIVISKNNSAIKNVEEELDKLNLPRFYLRVGNKKVMEELNSRLRDIVYETTENLKNMQPHGGNGESLHKKYHSLKKLEESINGIIKKKNRLQECENQLRHVEKRKLAFQESKDFRNIRFFKKSSRFEILRREIDRIAHVLQKLDDKGEISWWHRLLNRLLWSMTTDQFVKDGLLLQFELEDIYLNKNIDMLRKELQEEQLDERRAELAELYASKSGAGYIQESILLLQDYLYERSNQKDYKASACEILSQDVGIFYSKYKKQLRTIYPVFLTTADSLVKHFFDMLKAGTKADYIIMDEASQCDLVSGIPMLSLADNCVVVGDQKQLSAIRNNCPADIKAPDEDRDYAKQTFLSSIEKTWNIRPVVLQEHYRCDYGIINYCNKFFYDNSLIIYTEANHGSMQLLTVDSGKYAAIEEKEKSFYNDREIESIQEVTGGQFEKSFAITPFSAQEKHLRMRLDCTEDVCGTIHAFQGKEEETVYFSTVLNDLDFANRHLEGGHCMFNKELINVAVSRSKKKFVLVSDKNYLRKKNQDLCDLINYIETYGKEIPDKSVCIFDDLYRQMRSYTARDDLDNIFEKALFDHINDFCEMTRGMLRCRKKLPLGDLVTDKKFLDSHLDIRRFVLHENTHVDFTILNQINNPLLAIELDGSSHMRADQKERDEKKNIALEHMGIPLWRISSKEAYTKEEFMGQLKAHLNFKTIS